MNKIKIHLDTNRLLSKLKIMPLFWLVLCLTFALKLYIAHIVPITGDEAQYIYWGQHLAWGYYDHPPIIGWLMSLIVKISLNNIWVRIPQIITTTLIGYFIYFSLRMQKRKNAYLLAILYLISPFNIFNIAILTDTPLLFFTFFSVYFLNLAVEKNKFAYLALTGLCLGAAFLSKYLIFPILLALLIFFLFAANNKITNKVKKLIIIILFASPFVCENIIWNYYHDWVNLLFNLTLRNETAHFSFFTVIFYFAILLYLYNPILLCFFLYKIRTYNFKNNFWCYAAFIPIIFYFFLSFIKEIGLHWLFCAYPFFFIAMFWYLSEKQLKISNIIMLIFTLLHLTCIFIFLHLPTNIWQHNKYFTKINWFFHYDKIAITIKPYIDKGFFLTTPSYSQSYLLTYKYNNPAAVWGTGSVHGRDDDLQTDFKQLDKKNILIVDINSSINTAAIQPYFLHYQIIKKYLYGMPYNLIFGYNFDYLRYKNTTLKNIYKKYYQIPEYLPRGKFYFKAKYNL